MKGSFRLVFLSPVLFFFLFSSKALSQSENSVEKRLSEIEIQQNEIKARQVEIYTQLVEGSGRVSSFLNSRLAFGGFFETSLVSLSGLDMESQVSAASNLVGLNLASDISDRFNFTAQVIAGTAFSLQNVNNNPLVNPNQRQFGVAIVSVTVAQGYLDYHFKDAVHIQTGLGYVPFGRAFQQREPVLFLRRGGPQMLSTSTNGSHSIGVIAPLWMGIHINGTQRLSGAIWGYNLYTTSPEVNGKTLGGGARTWIRSEGGQTIGISVQSGRKLKDTYYAYGADMNLIYQRLSVTAEYARNKSSETDETPETYYIEPAVALADGQWIAFGVADYLSHPGFQAGVPAIADPFKQWRFGAGVNWLPLAVTRYRMTVLSHDYKAETNSIHEQKRDYFSVDFSCSVAF